MKGIPPLYYIGTGKSFHDSAKRFLRKRGMDATLGSVTVSYIFGLLERNINRMCENGED